MEIILRLLQIIAKIIWTILNTVLNVVLARKKPTIPPIHNRLLTLSIAELVELLKQRKLKSEDLVKAYIERIKEVEPHINAVVKERFSIALEESIRADQLIAKTSDAELSELFKRNPLLGIPCTVKESCGLKGMPIRVGSKQRAHLISLENGEVVQNVIDAGAIPLLVSITPEYCFSIETNPATQKRSLNPYDSGRAVGGSSGGEGALNGAGASLFGIGSDIGGSIRIPALFNGVFGHKPTGGITSIEGHFPGGKDPYSQICLQMGPITRFGRDLGLLMHVMAGKNADKLDLFTSVETNDIKIRYAFGFDGLNGICHVSADNEIKLSIIKAVKLLQNRGCQVEKVSTKAFTNSLEMALGGLMLLKDFPNLINTTNPNKVRECSIELLKSLFGKSEYTKEALYFDLNQRLNACMTNKQAQQSRVEVEALKSELTELLGSNGVLFLPTFFTSAIYHNTSTLALWNIDYTMIFNMLGFPATHIPMGLNDRGLPFGFQVIAAPYKDRLCFQIARELETALGGWIPPTPHNI